MRFFLDENFPVTTEALLRERGHETDFAKNLGKIGMDDQSIFARAQEWGAVFLTTDRDFYHTIPHMYPTHHGIIVIALRRPNRESITKRLLWMIDHVEEKYFSNRVFLLRDKTWMVYPAIPSGF